MVQAWGLRPWRPAGQRHADDCGACRGDRLIAVRGMQSLAEGQKLEFEIVRDDRAGKSSAGNLQAA